jgi:hypothetical protein
MAVSSVDKVEVRLRIEPLSLWQLAALEHERLSRQPRHELRAEITREGSATHLKIKASVMWNANATNINFLSLTSISLGCCRLICASVIQM